MHTVDEIMEECNVVEKLLRVTPKRLATVAIAIEVIANFDMLRLRTWAAGCVRRTTMRHRQHARTGFCISLRSSGSRANMSVARSMRAAAVLATTMMTREAVAAAMETPTTKTGGAASVRA